MIYPTVKVAAMIAFLVAIHRMRSAPKVNVYAGTIAPIRGRTINAIGAGKNGRLGNE